MWIRCTWEDSLMKMVKRIHKAPCLPPMLPPSNPAFPEQNMCLKFGTYHGFQVRCQPNSQKGYCASAKSDSWDGEMSCCPHIPTFLNMELIWLRSSEGGGDQPLHLKHTGQKETVNLTKRKPSSIYYSNQNVERWHFLGRIQQLQLCYINRRYSVLYINNKIKLNREHSFITPKSGNSQITLQVSDTS